MLKRLNRGFTVIELIIVIAVIGILASIAIVSYSGTQNRAKQSSSSATISQVKLKIGEFFTDNNYYPLDKPAVYAYLNSVGSGTLATEFNLNLPSGNPKYGYTATATSGGGACDNVATKCMDYTLTAKKEAWKGGTSDSDVTLRP